MENTARTNEPPVGSLVLCIKLRGELDTAPAVAKECSSIGRALVSKTSGCGFKSLHSCFFRLITLLWCQDGHRLYDESLVGSFQIRHFIADTRRLTFAGWFERKDNRVSRDIAGSKTNTAASGSSLMSELLHAAVYKPNQGRIVRQLTVLAIWLIVALGAWRLYATLNSTTSSNAVAVGFPAGILLAGLWIGYRLINWPRFADFLIAVEAEMKKVTWPSRDEVKRASIVVIVTIAILAISLFLFDVFWQAFFDALWKTA